MRGFSSQFEDLNGESVIEPRYVLALSFDDDSIAGANPNLLTYSEQFDHAGWSGGATVTANTDTAPDGATTADNIEDSNAAGYLTIYKDLTGFDVAARYTFSVFVKKDSVAKETRFAAVRIYFYGSTGESNFVRFDTSTGQFYVQSGASADPDSYGNIENYDADYWRISISAVCVDQANTVMRVQVYPAVGVYSGGWGDSPSATGDITIFGAQLSESPSALEYVPTTSAAVTAGSPDTDVTWLTSHSDALVLPGVGSADRIDSVIEARGISGTMQRITMDTGQHSIGSITIRVLDPAGALSDKIKAKLAAGKGLRRKRVRLYMGHKGAEWWTDYYQVIFTYIVDSIEYLDGVYTIKCSDIQRSIKTKIFDLHQGVLTSTIEANDTSIPVTASDASTKFPLVQHDSSYAAQASLEVGYIKIEDEIICHSGWNGGYTALTVVKRGALGTVAAKHIVTATEVSQRKKVDEYVHLQMTAPKLIYALLTGVLYGDSATLPSHWCLEIPTEFVKLADFTDIGVDLWDTSNNKGRRLRFSGLTSIEAKKFIEDEILQWLGCFSPVYASGEIGLRRIPRAGPESPYDDHLTDEADIVSYGALRDEMKALINSAQIKWNYIETLDRFTRVTGRIDADSIAKHGEAELKAYEFKGVFIGTNSDSDVFNFFVGLSDNFASPPKRLQITALPRHIRLEVGDTVRITAAGIRDFNDAASLDRVFAVTQMSVDWITGAVSLELFGGAEKTSAASLSDSDVLQDSYYTAAGSNLNTALTISADNVTATGSVTGAASNKSAIYYHNGDLTINAGVTVTATRNQIWRIKGFLTINDTGQIVVPGNAADGQVGKSLTGASVRAKVRWFVKTGAEVNSRLFYYLTSQNSVGAFPDGVPVLNILNPDGLSIEGIPDDLAGVGGLTGPTAKIENENFEHSLFSRTAAGGAGAEGGGGLVIICRGMTIAGDDAIVLSGAAGSAGSTAASDGGTTVRGQTGAGGFPGTLTVLIDGDYTAPIFTADNVTALRGNQDAPGSVDKFLPASGVRLGDEAYGQNVGGDTLNYYQACTRVQYIPPPVEPFEWSDEDERKQTPNTPTYERDLTGLQLDNWFEVLTGVNAGFGGLAYGVSATIPAGAFVMVGESDGSNSRIYSSSSGEYWLKRSNTLGNHQLFAVAFAEDLFVTVGGSFGGAVIATSPDGSTWTSRTMPGTETRFDVAHGADGNFVAVGNDSGGGDVLIWYSTDGITWSENNIGVVAGASSNGVAYGNGVWVAVGRSDGTRPRIHTATSPSGTWTKRTPPALDEHLHSVAYGNGVWVAVGSGDPVNSIPQIYTSIDDGVTWVQTLDLPDEIQGDRDLNRVRFINGKFLMVGDASAQGLSMIVSTPDGQTDFKVHRNPKYFALTDILYAEDIYVVSGENFGGSTEAYILRSVRR